MFLWDRLVRETLVTDGVNDLGRFAGLGRKAGLRAPKQRLGSDGRRLAGQRAQGFAPLR
jgi:hypothetical protein